MDANMSRRELLQYAGLTAASVVLGGCMGADMREDGRLIKTLDEIRRERPAYVGETYFLQQTNGNHVGLVTFEKLPKGVDGRFAVIGNTVSIVPSFKEGAKTGMQDTAYTIHYKDGTRKQWSTKVNYTLETEIEMGNRKFYEDQVALGKLKRGIFVHARGPKIGKKFSTSDYKKTHIEGFDYLDTTDYATKKGHLIDAIQDIQASLSDLGAVLSGKAEYYHLDKEGNLHVSRLRGAGESVDYLAQTLLDTLTNTTELAIQSVALNDGMSDSIAGAYDGLDSGLQIVKDSLPFGGAQVRTWMGLGDLLGSKELAKLPDGKPLSVVLGGGYYADVRKSGVRTRIDVYSSLATDAILTIIAVKAFEGGQGSGSSGGGVIIGPPAPPWTPPP